MSKRIDAPVGTEQPKAQSKDAPFVHRLVPTWGDADPARMIYTGRFPDFALRAWDAVGCAPLVVAGPVLLAARRHLRRQAAQLPPAATGVGRPSVASDA